MFQIIKGKMVKLLECLNGLMGTARQNTEIVDIIRANHSIRGEKRIILFLFLRILTGSRVT